MADSAVPCKVPLLRIRRGATTPGQGSASSPRYSPRDPIQCLEYKLDELVFFEGGELDARHPDSPVARLRALVRTLSNETQAVYERYGPRLFTIGLLYTHCVLCREEPGGPASIAAYSDQIFAQRGGAAVANAAITQKKRTFARICDYIETTLLAAEVPLNAEPASRAFIQLYRTLEHAMRHAPNAFGSVAEWTMLASPR
jgi:hypothetical protein